MDHPVNLESRKKGLNEANSIWLWGEGRKPQLQNFESNNSVKATVISAVDLLKGIGICGGMETPYIPNTTGYIDTDFEAKTNAGIEAFKNGTDLVYLHFEAPDECGHRGEAENKVKAIEMIDNRSLRLLLDYFKSCGEDYRILIMPDHPTPLCTMTHSSEAVPYLLFDSKNPQKGNKTFTEATCKASGNYVPFGPDIMNKLLGKI